MVFILSSEQWGDKFGSLIDFVKGFILNVWELRKVMLYGDNPIVYTTVPVSDCVWGAAGCRWWKG